MLNIVRAHRFALALVALSAIPATTGSAYNGTALVREDVDSRTMQAVYVAYEHWARKHGQPSLDVLRGLQVVVTRVPDGVEVAISAARPAAAETPAAPPPAPERVVIPKTKIPTTSLRYYADLSSYTIPGEHVAAFMAVERYREANGIPAKTNVHLGSPLATVHLVTNVDQLLLVGIAVHHAEGDKTAFLGCGPVEYYAVDRKTFAVSPYDGCPG